MAQIRLSEKEFWTILRKNAGLFSRTARDIRQTYGIEYSRQAVADRANKKKELLQDIKEENIDVAEEGLHSFMRSKNDRIKLRAIEFYLKTQGRSRGYVEKTESEITGKDGKDLVIPARVLTRKEAKELLSDLENDF